MQPTVCSLPLYESPPVTCAEELLLTEVLLLFEMLVEVDESVDFFRFVVLVVDDLDFSFGASFSVVFLSQP